jgi:hypothetical protein
MTRFDRICLVLDLTVLALAATLFMAGAHGMGLVSW